MNTKFEYLYRDAGNNKKWGDIIFTNHKNINLHQISSMLKEVLIQEEFFVAKTSGLPELSFENIDNELDHDWYEFSEISNTVEHSNDLCKRDITDFIKVLKQTST